MDWSLLFLVLLLAFSLPTGEGAQKPYVTSEDDERSAASAGQVSSESSQSVTDSTIMFLHVFKVSTAVSQNHTGGR